MLLFAITCWSLIWMYTTEVRGVKTLKLIASTGTEAAQEAAEAEATAGCGVGRGENGAAGVRPPALHQPL
jgi:hypothetical protein